MKGCFLTLIRLLMHLISAACLYPYSFVKNGAVLHIMPAGLLTLCVLGHGQVMCENHGGLPCFVWCSCRSQPCRAFMCATTPLRRCTCARHSTQGSHHTGPYCASQLTQVSSTLRRRLDVELKNALAKPGAGWPSLCCTSCANLAGVYSVCMTVIITRVSGQVHCAYSNKSTLVQDMQDTTRRPVT